MKLEQKKALTMKMRLNVNLNTRGQLKRSVKAHCLARMINLEAVMAASLYANPIEKRNWSIRHHADCTSLQTLRTTGQ
jgi:hypothetical protein